MHKPMTISVFPLTQNQNVTYLTCSSTKYTCTSELNFELHLSQKPGDRIFFMTLLSSIEVTHSIDILKKLSVCSTLRMAALEPLTRAMQQKWLTADCDIG